MEYAIAEKILNYSSIANKEDAGSCLCRAVLDRGGKK